VSDGASAHFKNNKNMINLTYHQSEFGLPAAWTFSATSHGKGPVDGIGAAIKSRATRYTLKTTTESALLTPEELYRFARSVNDHQTMKGDLEPNRPIEVFFIKQTDVETRLEEVLDKRWSWLPKKPWIDGIQSFHQFDPKGVGDIDCRRTSFSRSVESFTCFQPLG
jgi:molybdopterin-guanine dinucleotide biosynthesis protein A